MDRTRGTRAGAASSLINGKTMLQIDFGMFGISIYFIGRYSTIKLMSSDPCLLLLLMGLRFNDSFYRFYSFIPTNRSAKILLIEPNMQRHFHFKFPH